MSGTTGGINALIPMQAGVGVTPVQNPLLVAQQYAQTGNALLDMQRTVRANKLWDAHRAIQFSLCRAESQ